MASAKKKPEGEVVPGKAESLPGLPGPAEQLEGGVEPALEPIITAPHDGATLAEAVDLSEEAQARIAALPPEEKAKLAEIGAMLVENLAATPAGSIQHPELTPPAPCHVCTAERPCSIECWTKAGLPPKEYEPFLAKIDAQRATAILTPPTPTGSLTFRVWKHGSLRRNKITHTPGSLLVMTPDEAEDLGPVLEPVDDSVKD